MKYECIVSKKTLGYEKELKNEHLAEKYKILKQKVLWDDSFAVVVIKNTIWIWSNKLWQILFENTKTSGTLRIRI